MTRVVSNNVQIYVTYPGIKGSHNEEIQHGSIEYKIESNPRGETVQHINASNDDTNAHTQS